MIPVLYKANATDFSTYGIGTLTETTSCKVTEERNGAFECVLQYPSSGYLYKEIKKERIIKAKPNDTKSPQAFRIYKISTPINGLITVYAQHISYDLSDVAVMPFSEEGIAPQMAIEKVLANTTSTHNFYFLTDYSEAKNFSVTAVNTLIADKDKLLDDCRYMQSILSDTSEIEEELKRQNEELEVLTEMLRKCVEENTHKVQNQKEYWEKYNSIEGRWNAVRSKIAELEETKKARTIKAEIIGAFMFELHEQDCAIEDFDARLWTVTIDSVVVNKDGSFTYKFRNDLELTVPAE